MNKFYDFRSFVSSIVYFLSVKSNPRKNFIGAYIVYIYIKLGYISSKIMFNISTRQLCVDNSKQIEN